MTIELTVPEAEIMIAVLVFAEGAAEGSVPAIAEALKVLRPWRSALLIAYLRARADAPVSSAVDPCAATVHR
jgi:hypothetical protein